MNVLGMLYPHTILHILNEKIPIDCIYEMLHYAPFHWNVSTYLVCTQMNFPAK